MRNKSWIGVVAVMLACGTWLGTPAMAQDAAATPGPNEVESDPIRCWWRTDRSAVRVAEPFTLVLTCSVIETARVKVEADASRLDPVAMVLVPFEVTGGRRFEDIVAPPWRYFQYEYTVRLIGEEFFGQDVSIPPAQVPYTVQTGGATGTEGRDLVYVLPPLPLRVESLVPATASDIRDAALDTFGDTEARQFRSTAALVASGVFFSFALVLAALALKGIADRYRARVPAATRPLPSWRVMRACVDSLGQLKEDVAREGWGADQAGRALAAFRIAGAVALRQPVTQAIVDRHAPEREGQLALRKGLLRPKRALISAPTTPATIAAQLSNGHRPDVRTEAMLEDIRASLHVFSAARYGRNGHVTSDALDSALDQGTTAVRQLSMRQMWPIRPGELLGRKTGARGQA